MQILEFLVLIVLSTVCVTAIKQIPCKSLSQNEANCGTATSFVSCQNCTHAAVCFRGEIYENFACADLNPNTPFCSSGPNGDECTAKIGNICACPNTPAASEYKCSGLGFYPDPHDCTKYHHCDVQGELSALHSCPTGYVYNMQLLVCEEFESNQQCVTVNCEKMRSPLNVFPTATLQYYAFCQPRLVDGVIKRTPSVFRCANSSTFEQQNQRCVYHCARVGRFPNSERPNLYFQCTYQGTTLVGNLMACPAGQTFNATVSACT